MQMHGKNVLRPLGVFSITWVVNIILNIRFANDFRVLGCAIFLS